MKMRAILTALLTIPPLVFAAVAIVPQPAQAALNTLTASPAAPIKGENFTLSFQLSTKIPRAAWLQRKSGSSWSTLAKGKTGSTGKGSFVTHTWATSNSYRIYAPKVTYRTTSYATRYTATKSLTALAQSATLTLATSAGDSARVTAKARFSPKRLGRKASLQELTGGTWRSIAASTQDSGGFVVFDRFWSIDEADKHTFRVWGWAANGAPSYRTPERLYVAGPRTVVVDDPDFASVGQDGKVLLEAHTSGAVTKVRFFVDGKAVGEDATSPWSLGWLPKVGRHDITARAFGTSGSVLSTSLSVTLPSSLGVDEESGLSPGFGVEAIASGFDLPTSFAIVDISKVFVAEKSGVVKMFGKDNGGGFSQPVDVLDIHEKVLHQSDRGLIGIAVDPDFGDNGFIYLSYVVNDGTGNTAEDERVDQVQRVERYTVENGVADPASAHTVLGSVTGPDCYNEGSLETPDCLPLHGFSHTIGDLAFDNAGNLLVAVGDGALIAAGIEDRRESLRSQNSEVLAGKILRVDKSTGKGVPDNPFYEGDGSSNASRILAKGFRNPFRLTVREDGKIFVGEVGEATFEEIDMVDPLAAGGNYGWPCFEGKEESSVAWTECDALRGAEGVDEPIAPIHTYGHESGASITGGVFYTGQAYPEEYQGRYFFGDYAQNFIRTAGVTEAGEVSGTVYPFASSSAAGGPVKFAMAPDDTIWYLSIYSGELRKINFTGASTTTSCSVGTFRTSYFDIGGDGSALNVDYGESSWWVRFASVTLPTEALASRCEESIHLESTTDSPWPSANVPSDQFGIRWQGRVPLEGGTYEFTVLGRDWMRLSIDGVTLHDWFANTFWAENGVPNKHTVRLTAGIHNVNAELIHNVGGADADVTWQRVGSPPTVRLTVPANGTTIGSGESIGYTVEASDAEDPGVDAADVKVVADLMHFSGDSYHFHPEFDHTGSSGTFVLQDDHAPLHSVFRLTGKVTDASGEVGVSAPVYVCLVDNVVGPCALD